MPLEVRQVLPNAPGESFRVMRIGAEEKEFDDKLGASHTDDLPLRTRDGFEGNLGIDENVCRQCALEGCELRLRELNHDVRIIRRMRNAVRVGHQPARYHVGNARRSQRIEHGTNPLPRIHPMGRSL